MAATTTCDLASLSHAGGQSLALEEDYKQSTQILDEDSKLNSSQRAQWLRAAVLGANDGLVSIAALIMVIGAVKRDMKAMVLGGFAGACSVAIGEFVSVYTQYEVEVAPMKREMSENDEEKQMEKRTRLPNPYQAAFASALSFSIGALVPLLAAAFITDYKIRLIVVVAVATLALTMFGLVGAVLGKTLIVRSCVRVVFGGWIATAITFGLTKVLGSCGLELYE